MNSCSKVFLRLAFTTVIMLCTVFAESALAIESETISNLAMRFQKRYSSDTTLTATLTTRWMDQFIQHEREIADLNVARRFGAEELASGYQIQYSRLGQPGMEHRLWQQYRHIAALYGNTFETSVRLEERYFTNLEKLGGRLRIGGRWNKALGEHDTLRLGYEWVGNLRTISSGNRRGISQDRLITTFQHDLQSGNRLDFEYQLRYQHTSIGPNTIQHQLQLTYAYQL
jgi:hypothetical protein